MNTSLQGRTLFRRGTAAVAFLALGLSVRATYNDLPDSAVSGVSSSDESWLSLSIGAFDSDGAGGSLQRQRQHEDAGFGGIDSMHLRRSVGEDRTLTIDGRAILGDNEYRFSLLLEDQTNGWHLGAGFRESRVFYNGVGGYSPGGLWIHPYDDEAYIDRGEYWIEAGVTKEAWTFTLRGSHSYRKGIKDSTQWGDAIYAGLGASNSRNIVGSWLDIDETRNTVVLDIEYDGEKTEAGAGLRLENIETDNSRNILRNPGQANPTGNGQRYLITREGSDADLFAGHMYVVQQVGDRLTLSGAGSFTTLDTTLTGERVYGASPDSDYDPAFPRGSTAHGYNDLEGDTRWDQWVLVGNAYYVPAKGWNIIGGIRYENQSQDGFSEYDETFGPANNANEPLPFAQENDRDFDEVLLSIEANYNGLANWVFTPFAEYATGEGSLLEFQEEFEAGHWEEVIDRDTDFDRDYLKYGLNARWYPSTYANAGFGVFRRERNNSYDTIADNTPPVGGNRYPAFIADQDFVTDDIYVKGTLRPASAISITARWDRQRTEIESTEMLLAAVTAAKQDTDIVSATLSWQLRPSTIVQAGVNKVYDQMVTGSVSANSAVAPSVSRFSSDYTTYNALVLFALNEEADVQVDYYRFRSDNYRSVYLTTLPYGLSATDEVYGVTYSQKLSANRQFSVRYVYSQYDERTSGGFNDFDSHMIYGRLQMRF